MANFPKAAPIGVLSAVGGVLVNLKDDDGVQVLWGRVELENAAGEVLRSWDGDLSLYLNNGQVNQLQNILSAIRTRAAAEML